MKKIILALVVLMFAAPAMAAVTISIADDATNDGWATISYTQPDTSAGKRVRAFGLDITASAGEICAVDVPGGAQPFNTYVGTVEIDAQGNVTNPGNPVAVGGSPGSAGVLGDGAITIEMGSLYDKSNPGQGQPLFTGTLLRVKVNTSCTLTITENAARKGIVCEDGTQPGLAGGSGAVTVVYGGPDWEQWQLMSQPVSWTWAKQCHGDANNGTELHPSGKGQVAVGFDDFDDYFAPNWLEPTPAGLMADFNHDEELHPSGKGMVRVGFDDFDVLVEYWLDPDAEVPGDCQSCTPASP